VILADLMLDNELEGSLLSNTFNKMEARHKGAQKEVSEHDHGCLLDEISTMDILDFVEDEEDIMDWLGSKGEQSMDAADKSSDS
jgi:hypothetical protein